MQIPVDKIFFINLDRSHARLKALQDHLQEVPIRDKNGCEPIRFPALNGNQISHSIISKSESGKYGLPLSMGEKGCHASHRALLQMQIENNWEYVMYLEDDVRIQNNKIQELIKNWDQLPEFDFFNLSWKNFKHPFGQQVQPIEFPIPNLYSGNGMWLTHCYILSLYGAKKCEEHSRMQSHSIDWHYAGIQSWIKTIGFKYGTIAIQERKMRSTIIHT